MNQPVDRAIVLRNGEQVCDAGENDEQVAGEASGDLVDLRIEVPRQHEHADDEGGCDGERAHVDWEHGCEEEDGAEHQD